MRVASAIATTTNRKHVFAVIVSPKSAVFLTPIPGIKLVPTVPADLEVLVATPAPVLPSFPLRVLQWIRLIKPVEVVPRTRGPASPRWVLRPCEVRRTEGRAPRRDRWGRARWSVELILLVHLEVTGGPLVGLGSKVQPLLLKVWLLLLAS